jgi:protein SCO1/2
VKLRIAAALVAVIALLSACTGGSSKPSSKTSELNIGPNGAAGAGKYQGFGLDTPQPRPAFTLTDTAGKTFNFQTETAKQPTLLYFGYTHCPDVCPATMADIALAVQALPKADQAKVQVVFVTTDVKQDTGPVIQAWLSKFDVGLPTPFVGLYGTQAQIDAAQAAAHVMLATEQGQQHAANVLLYGSDDYAHVQYLQSNNESDQMAHDLPLVGA